LVLPDVMDSMYISRGQLVPTYPRTETRHDEAKRNSPRRAWYRRARPTEAATLAGGRRSVSAGSETAGFLGVAQPRSPRGVGGVRLAVSSRGPAAAAAHEAPAAASGRAAPRGVNGRGPAGHRRGLFACQPNRAAPRCVRPAQPASCRRPRPLTQPAPTLER
jgi:hypothetical protein